MTLVSAVYQQVRGRPTVGALLDALVGKHPAGGHPQFAAAADGDGINTTTVDELVALARQRPIILLELHPLWQPPGQSPAEVEELLARNRYTPRLLEETDANIRRLWTPDD